ncbi:MAG: DUF1338 domain-containing protein [Bacteroidales bacterium]|nr:DUF1338 domain-containing protein [Bacteroidales bacterium]
MNKANDIFDKLWTIYTEQNPQAKHIHELFVERGENVINDHIAFRTFDDSRIDIEVLAKPFIESGYEHKGDYHFPEKKLYAKHYEHKTDKNAPRVFISQLITKEFSAFLQETISDTISKTSEQDLISDKLIYSGKIWGEVSYEIYNKLREESEYAAWLYVNGFRANHFTVSVNNLKTFDGIREVNQFLKDNGLLMNDSGGEVKGTKEQLLEQSSIKAGMELTNFKEGQFEVPACYYEFAMRYPDKKGNLYSGFIANSADKIFESTDFYKK